MTQRSALRMTEAEVRAHATKHGHRVPFELRPNLPDPAKLREKIGPKRKGSRKLKQHRQPNETEKRYGLVLEAMKRRGEIVYYGFEEITLRWADMVYTPDFFVIRQQCTLQYAGLEKEPVSPENPVRHLIEAVYIEVKGSWKWQKDIVKWKAARGRFTWARFEMWDYVDGRWTQLA